MKEVPILIMLVGTMVTLFISFGAMEPLADQLKIDSVFASSFSFLITLSPMLLWFIFVGLWDFTADKINEKKKG